MWSADHVARSLRWLVLWLLVLAGGGSRPSSARSRVSWWRSKSLIDTRHQRSAAWIHGGKYKLVGGLFVGKAGDHFGASAFLDEAALGEVGGAHPDAVAHRHPVDDQQCVQVIDEASRGYVATIDLCGVVDSFTRPDILAADLEKQTRACRSDLPHLGVKLSWV
jgi:hypothetical protein